MVQKDELRICKKCLLIDQSSREKDVIYRYIKELSQKDKTPEEEFISRLDVCRQCEWLQAATCQACGCFVEARAALKKQSCPYHKW